MKRTEPAAVTAGVVAMTMPPIAPVISFIPYSMNTLNRNIPPTAIPARRSQSPREIEGSDMRREESGRSHTSISGTSAIAASTIRAPDATNTGNASVTILLTGVPLPKIAIPAASRT
ncbi:MAG TPA: hypothetical protein VK920_02665 [Solirubrobacterales bacterium]|nr:hypothetical protein [Solirubrobacterales bacterium]